MLIKHSQQDIIFDIPENVKNVGLKISGGADSAIVCFMLSKYVYEERKDLKIIPITVQCILKSFQVKFSNMVLNFCKDYFSDEIFGNHVIDKTKKYDEYISKQRELVTSLYDAKKIDIHYIGLTQNPPKEVTQYFDEFGPYAERDFTGELKPTKLGERSYRPLVNINKKGVAELYKKFNLMDTLFPLTRSCECWDADKTNNYITHCGECWFCEERYWGFGKLR